VHPNLVRAARHRFESNERNSSNGRRRSRFRYDAIARGGRSCITSTENGATLLSFSNWRVPRSGRRLDRAARECNISARHHAFVLDRCHSACGLASPRDDDDAANGGIEARRCVQHGNGNSEEGGKAS
jgi:hypothetical protein